MKSKKRNYSGTKSPEISKRELDHREIARVAAAEGYVLLQNKGILPLKDSANVFLAGNGAIHSIKGGTGSGDVNEREVIDIFLGLKNAGINIVNAGEIQKIRDDYAKKIDLYAKKIIEITRMEEVGSDMRIFDIISENRPKDIGRPSITPEGLSDADAAVFTISRVAGEGADRFAEAGDYYLSKEEEQELEKLSQLTDQIIVVINAGGPIDLKKIVGSESVAAILTISQGGMEMGSALADILTGKVTPSGKLTTSWAKNYEDIPSSKNFSHNNGDLKKEYYEDGIYVGYRYFDSFGIEAAFPFGYGLSYTEFSYSDAIITADKNRVMVSVTVTNTGKKYAGKEAVQFYAACPQEEQKKEYKRLVGFRKTSLLAPLESERLTVEIPAKNFASYRENEASFVLEQGDYGIFVGASSADIMICGILTVEKDIVLETLKHIMPLQDPLTEIVRPDAVIEEKTVAWRKAAADQNIRPIIFAPRASDEKNAQLSAEEAELEKKSWEIANRLTDEELTALLMGEISKGQDYLKEDELFDDGLYVPGAAGETTQNLLEKYDLPPVSMADGPAGLRLLRSYDVDRASGKIYSRGLLSCLEGGLFAAEHRHENVDTYYQYATAIPVGTCLAQTFNTELVSEIGRLVGNEMTEMGISWWLAPGMNIHRNPLCGRNFEYYSEDPLLAGKIAAAMTNGVQSVPGVGTTIKHFACNNQEDNRLSVDSVVSERALREIYLRNFEIAVKESQPMCIMTSYNLINGIHSANNYDLCTVAAREEWGFEGIIMTDWLTTIGGDRPSVPHVCAIAGNDLIMPGYPQDREEILNALRTGLLPREMARCAAKRMILVILQTLAMENSVPYHKTK